MKLLRVCRTPAIRVHSAFTRHGEVDAISPVPVTDDIYQRFELSGEFFMVEDNEVQGALQWLATNNPGRDIEVYSLETIAVAPAAAVVFKKITKDGVLPL